jgi:VanZ family protein
MVHAEPIESKGPRPSRRGAVPWTAWLAVTACIALILWLGSPRFSLVETSRWLHPLLIYLFPDLTAGQLWKADLLVRKCAHVTEYGALAVITFRALWLSFDTLLMRLAAGAVFTAVAVATIDESRQAFTTVRTGSPRDVLLDASAAAVAVTIAIWVLRQRRARRPCDSQEPPDVTGAHGEEILP